MTRFIYLTDTHIGANPVGYHQQPAYPEQVNQLLNILEKEIKTNPIDFVIHGGDLVDSCTQENIRQASDLFSLSVPVYLCLGNHDLDTENALGTWLKNAPSLFQNNQPSFEIINENCMVHIAPNHWEAGLEFYWKGDQDPYLSDHQMGRIEEKIIKFPDYIHILVTHSPVFGMKTEQSGLPGVIHEAPYPFRKQMKYLVNRHSNLKLVLSGHSHMNTITSLDHCQFVTGSAFVETPFEYKIIDVTSTHLSVSTHRINMDQLVGFQPLYNEEKSFVQGREMDRNKVIRF